ncbi:MAG TPA: Lrp/AsnC family transcriptional regulator [Euzebya sp.]|nr:Lrp/AsnC family transcriptional regulator [Euzebya sp.]
MPALDPVDADIVAHLLRDGRISVNALADGVGVSRANAYRRLDRLHDEEVITGYRAVIDPRKVGLDVVVLIMIGVQQRRWQDIAVTLRAIEGVEYLAATTGEFDFLALVRLSDVSHLRDVVLEELHSTPGVVTTRTVFVLDEQGLETL